MGIFTTSHDEKAPEVHVTDATPPRNELHYFEEGYVTDNQDDLQRRLGNRQIQLLAIGGSIGTALFVSIGGALANGGPAGTLLAYTIYSTFLGLVNNCVAEMTVMMPVSGGFIRLAGQWVDDAWGFMAGWNFFFYEALLIPFEITALCTVLNFWREDIPNAVVTAIVIVLYAMLNVLAVRFYGEAEFWLSGGKVLLIIMLYLFTFIAMCGGNPKGDAFGFRHWDHPGGWVGATDLLRFQGFLKALWAASFCVVGPEYLSMVAAEAKRPRIYIKAAFKTMYWRFGVFFIAGAICVGVLVRSDNATLQRIFIDGTGRYKGTGAASPYVIAMQRLGVEAMPSLVNALLVTSIFSAGNTYTYCATRSLYGLALDSRAPKILTYCTRRGVPVGCFAVVMIFPCLSFLQLNNDSNVVLEWMIWLTTAGGIINYIVMCVTYICFYNACKAQKVNRRDLPYFGRFQPYSAYLGLAWMVMIVFCFGYESLSPWDPQTFFIHYSMLIIAPLLFIGWKLYHRTAWIRSLYVDLEWEKPVIDAYEATFIDEPVGFWKEMVQLVGFRKVEGGNDKRNGSFNC